MGKETRISIEPSLIEALLNTSSALTPIDPSKPTKWQIRQLLEPLRQGLKVAYKNGDGDWILWSDDAPGLARFTQKAYPAGCNSGIQCPFGDIGDRLLVESHQIALEITNVRLEKIQNMTDKDAIAEGIPPSAISPRDAFAKLWNEIHGKDKKAAKGKLFSDNPWVWAIEFRRISPAIVPPLPENRGSKVP